MKRIISNNANSNWPFNWLDKLPPQWGGAPEKTPEYLAGQEIDRISGNIQRNLRSIFRGGKLNSEMLNQTLVELDKAKTFLASLYWKFKE